jgi:hypothetical protein
VELDGVGKKGVCLEARRARCPGALRSVGNGVLRSVGKHRPPAQRTRERRRENDVARGFLGAPTRWTLVLDRSVPSFRSTRGSFFGATLVKVEGVDALTGVGRPPVRSSFFGAAVELAGEVEALRSFDSVPRDSRP